MAVNRESSASKWFRQTFPQALTASRVAFGAAAIIAVGKGSCWLSATLITFGAITDVLDGKAARGLGTTSAFGALFDTFTDYLCFVVAPWMLVRAVARSDGSLLLESIVAIPLLTGAIRYARNSLIISTQRNEVRELPGLATVFFAFLPVVVVFADAQNLIDAAILRTVIAIHVVVLSLLMVTTIRYPKLTRFRLLTVPVTLSLVVMPFFATQALALAVAIAGLLYVLLAPVLIRRKAK